MSCKRKDIVAFVKKNGWISVDWTGGHQNFKHPNGGKKLQINNPASGVLKRGTAASIYKQAKAC